MAKPKESAHQDVVQNLHLEDLITNPDYYLQELFIKHYNADRRDESIAKITTFFYRDLFLTCVREIDTASLTEDIIDLRMAGLMNKLKSANFVQKMFLDVPMAITLKNLVERPKKTLIEIGQKSASFKFYLKNGGNFSKLRHVYQDLIKPISLIHTSGSVDFETCFTTTDPMSLSLHELINEYKSIVKMVWKNVGSLKTFVQGLEKYIELNGVGIYDYLYGVVEISKRPNYNFGNMKSKGHSSKKAKPQISKSLSHLI